MTGSEAEGKGPEPSGAPRRGARPGLFVLRGSLSPVLAVAFSVLCLLIVYGLWSAVTAGAPEERVVPRATMPSPGETFGSFRELWFDRALTRNALVTIRRVFLGFLLAAGVGVPLGILCGCFAPIQAFFLPLTVFGRNIPIAALIPLTFACFGIGEAQKVMFIFIACVMFVVADTAGSIRDIDQRYVDTAYTLGARRRQIITKVLVPLAMPAVFNSLRLLFGLAFGYIMLAEVIKFGTEAGGLGDIIEKSQRRGLNTHIWLVLLIIPLVAIVIDRILYAMQRSLFPYRYGGGGMLNAVVRWLGHRYDDLKTAMFRRGSAGSGQEVKP